MKKFTSAVLTLCMVLSLLPAVALSVLADNAPTSGYCGGEGDRKNLQWSIDPAAGTLTISGTGKMKDYIYSTDGDAIAPWCLHASKLKKLIICQGVTSIGDYAFSACSEFTGVLTIPDSVTSIGKSAFDYCDGFTGSLIIPDRVTTIKEQAFMCCSGFTGSLNIGKCVKSIGYEAFYDCSGFSGSLTIPDSVTSMDSNAFSNCSGFDGSLIVGNGITEINSKVFSGTNNFKGDLILGNQIKTIGDSTFCNYRFTGSLTIGKNVTDIGYGAFSGCRGFTGLLTIPTSVTNIGPYAFCNCSGFTGSLTIPDSVMSIGCSAFCNCSGFNGQLKISNSITCIDEAVFSDCSGFTGSLMIPDSVKIIRNEAFWRCSGFTGSLEIPNNVTDIESEAFDFCNGFSGSLRLSENLVTIGMQAFDECKNLTGNLIIPNSVTCIEMYAFYGCGFNGTINIGNHVTSIGKGAFAQCSKLTGSLIIPDSVTSIGGGFYTVNDSNGSWHDEKAGAFTNCSGLNGTLTLGKGLQEIGDYAFDGCSNLSGDLIIPAGTQLNDAGRFLPGGVFCNCKKFNHLILNRGTKKIPKMAFYGCSGLTGTLTIPDSVVEIGHDAFNGCNGFTGSLIIPNSVTSIESQAFSNCSGFTGSLSIGNGITEIDDDMFSGTNNFKGELVLGNKLETISPKIFNKHQFTGSLKIPDSVTSVGENAFSDCSGFTGSLTIPDSVKSIGDSAFSGCNGFTGTLTVGNGVTDIGKKIFGNCSGFTGSLTIPDSVTSIGCSAFENCSGLTGLLTIPDSVTSIGGGAFSGCSGLTGLLTIPDSVTSIGSGAFSGCSGLTGLLTIPDSVTSIGCSAFENCSGLTGLLTIPDKVTSIDSMTFCDCSGLTGPLTIPDSVTSIGYLAFENCSGLTGPLTIPDSVTSIGHSAFENCSGFSGPLTIPDSVTSIGYSAFENCSGLTGPLTIPDSVTSIGRSAFENCSGFTGPLTIPASTTTIGCTAFNGCKIADVYYGGTKEQWNKIRPYDFPDVTMHYSSAAPGVAGKDASGGASVTGVLTDWSAQNATLTLSGGVFRVAPAFSAAIFRQPLTYYKDKSVRCGLQSSQIVSICLANASSVFGTFQASDASNVTIDGKTYPYKSGLVIPQETYQGKFVCCALEDATVTSIQLAESVTGVWSAYNSSTGLMTIGGKSYTLSPEIDSVWFLGSADAMLGTQVTAIVIGSEIYHLDSDDTTVTGKLTALDGSSLTLDGKTYYCASDAIGRSKISVGQRVQCLLKKGVIQEIRVAGVVTGSLDAFDSAAKTVTIGNTVDKTTGDFNFGSLPAIGTFVVCRTLDGTVSAVYTKEQAVIPTASAHVSGNLSYSDGAYQTTASVCIRFAVVPSNGFAAEELAGIDGLKTNFGDVTLTGDNTLSLDSGSIVRSRTVCVGVLDTGGDKTIDFSVSGDPANLPTDKKSSNAGINVTRSDGQVLCACSVPVCNLDFQRMQAEKKKAASEAGKKAAALEKTYDSSSTIAVDLSGALPNLTVQQREAAEEYLQAWASSVVAIYTKNTTNKESIDKKLYDKLLSKLGIDPKLVNLITPTTVKASTVVTFNGGKEQYRFELTGPYVSSSMYLTLTMQDISGGDKTPVGNVCYTNIEQFCNALEEILDDALKNSYDELYSKGVDEMADMCIDKTLLKLINKKCGSFSNAVYNVTVRGEERSLKKYQVNCPVDVYVYDSSNTLCGKIVDNVVDSSLTDLNMYVEGDSKIVYLAGDDYHIKLVGSDSGTMSCSVTEYGGDLSELRTVTMVNVPLTRGSEYGSYVDEKPNQASSLYQLYDKNGSAVGELQDTAPSSLKVTKEAISGSTVKLTLSATIGRDDPEKACKVIVAAYDENGKLLATGTTALTGDGTAYCVISTDFNCSIPADRKLRLSVFALDSESAAPVCAAQSLLYEVGT